MRETLVIEYRGELISVDIVDEIGGHLDDLHNFDDFLLRDSDGRYYLRQCRYLKMPPNAEDLYDEKMCKLSENDPSDDTELERKRFIHWRQQLTKPHTTIKRITEKTALLWRVDQCDDEQLRRRLRQGVIAMCSRERSTSLNLHG
jgi:hypothetical protein